MTTPPVIGQIRSFTDAQRALENLRNYFAATTATASTAAKSKASTATSAQLAIDPVTNLKFTTIPPDKVQASWEWSWHNNQNVKYRVYLQSPTTKRSANEIYQDLAPYDDITNGINTAYINSLYDLGVKTNIGAQAGLFFGPEQKISREEAAQFLVGAWNGVSSVLPPINSANDAYFTDISSTDAYIAYLNLMYERQLITGLVLSDGAKIAYPMVLLTRGQAAAWIVRFHNVVNGHPTNYGLSGANAGAYYSDVAASDTRLQWINTLKELSVGWGMTVTSSPGLFRPDTLISRETFAYWAINALGQAGSSAAYNAYFYDIVNDFRAPFINKLYELGGTPGLGVALFYFPGNSITQTDYASMLSQVFNVNYASVPVIDASAAILRKDAAVWLIRTMGQQVSTAAYNAYFTDVANDTYAPYINRLFEIGIVEGIVAPSTFAPDVDLNRGSAAIQCVRALNRAQLITYVQGDTQLTVDIPANAYFMSFAVWAMIEGNNTLSPVLSATYQINPPAAVTNLIVNEILSASGGSSALSINFNSNDPMATEYDIYIIGTDGTKQFYGTVTKTALVTGGLNII